MASNMDFETATSKLAQKSDADPTTPAMDSAISTGTQLTTPRTPRKRSSGMSCGKLANKWERIDRKRKAIEVEFQSAPFKLAMAELQGPEITAMILDEMEIKYKKLRRFRDKIRRLVASAKREAKSPWPTPKRHNYFGSRRLSVSTSTMSQFGTPRSGSQLSVATMSDFGTPQSQLCVSTMSMPAFGTPSPSPGSTLQKSGSQHRVQMPHWSTLLYLQSKAANKPKMTPRRLEDQFDVKDKE